MGLFVLAVALAPARAQARRAFVTCEADDRLVVVDLLTMQVLKSLPTGKTPHVVVFTPGGKGYVNNRGSPSLTVVDAHRLEVVRTIPLPATSFQLALSPDGRTLAVACKDRLALLLVDTATDTVLRTVELGPPPAGAPGGALTRHPLWSADSRTVWVPDCAHNTLVHVDAATGALLATLPVPAPVHYLHRWPDARTLCAVTEGAGASSYVVLLDDNATTPAHLRPLPFPAAEKPYLHHGQLAPDLASFFVCRDGGREVLVLDVEGGQQLAQIPTRPGPGHAASSADGRRMFVIHHRDSVVSVIDVAQRMVIKTIQTGAGAKHAHACYLSADGGRFYVANAESGTLVAIDTATLEVAGSVAVGNTPMFFGVQEGEAFPPTE